MVAVPPRIQSPTPKPRLLIVSGPSCAGKSPLCAAARKREPALFEDFSELVLYHSRSKRPEETEGEDYFFRTREAIEALRHEDDHVVWTVRDDLQALDLGQLTERLADGSVLYEGNFRIALDLRRRVDVPCLTVFVSPLTRDEVLAWKEDVGATVDERVTEMMRRRLLRRAHSMKATLSQPDLESIEARASDAIEGLRCAHLFDHVIPNHDGEDSDHWELASEPIGDARVAVEALCALVADKTHPRVERWAEDVMAGV